MSVFEEKLSLSPGTPALLKRKDFLGVDEEAKFHAHRTYYYRKGTDTDDVIRTCTKQLAAHPQDSKALFLRGSTYVKMRKYTEGVADLTHALEINSYYTEAYYQRGVAFARLNEHERAIVDLTVVLDADPDNVNAAFARAASYNAIGQFGKAIEDYNFALLKDETGGQSGTAQEGGPSSKAGTTRRNSRRNLSPSASLEFGTSNNSASGYDAMTAGLSGSPKGSPVLAPQSDRRPPSSGSAARSIDTAGSSAPTSSPGRVKAGSGSDSDSGSGKGKEVSRLVTTGAKNPAGAYTTPASLAALLSEAQNLYDQTRSGQGDENEALAGQVDRPGGGEGEQSREESSDEEDFLADLKVTIVPSKGKDKDKDKDKGVPSGRSAGPTPSTARPEQPSRRRTPPPLPPQEANREPQTEARVSPNRAQTADTYHSMGYQLRREGDYGGAIKYYTMALQAEPNHFKALFNRGFAHDKLGDYEAAITDYTNSLHLEPRNAFAFYNRGISRDRSGHFDEAYLDFSEAIAFVPDNPDFFHNRAFCLRKLGRIVEAVADYTECLKIAPGHFKARHNRGYCYECLNETNLALEDYSAALEIDPSHIGTLSARASIYERLGDMAKCIQEFRKAISLCDQNTDEGVKEGKAGLMVALGRVYSKSGRIEEGNACYSEAAGLLAEQGIRSSDDDGLSVGTVLFMRALNFKAQERYTLCIEDLSAVLEMSPSHLACYTHRGFCYRKLEQYEASIADYGEVIRQQPQNVRAFNNRAYCLARLGRYDAAVQDYSTVIALDPGNSHAYHNRGISLDKLGHFDSAIADFTKVLEIDSGTERVDRGSVEDAQQHAAHMLQQQQQQQQQQQSTAIPAKAFMASLGPGGQEGWL